MLPFLLALAFAAPSAADDRVAALASDVAPLVREWRRDFHRNPELSFKEHRTAGKVADILKQLGVDEVRTGVGGTTGVVATIKGSRPGPMIALRADMDALPIQEPADAPYASQNPGVMHACGHDGHMAILLGAADVLVRSRDRMAGSVRLIFEAAEETPPSGAPALIDAGALDGVSAALALHVAAFIDLGKVEYTLGPAMANAEFLKITVKGRGGHGSTPWKGVNSVLVASRIVEALTSVLSHETDPRDPAVLTINTSNAGAAPNVTPDQAVLTGTIRTFTDETQARVHAALIRAAEHTAKAHGAEAVVEIGKGYPAVFNDAALADRLLPAVRAAAGDAAVGPGPRSFGGESFAFYGKRVPGFLFWLGTWSPSTGGAKGNHSPNTRLDEAALDVGVRAMAGAALRYLDTAPTN